MIEGKLWKGVVGFGLVASLAACGSSSGGNDDNNPPPPVEPPPAGEVVSLQELAVRLGVVNFVEVDPQIDPATFAAGAAAASGLTPLDSAAEVAKLASRSTIPASTGVAAGDIWPTGFFDSTTHIGGVAPGSDWTSGWTLNEGTGSLLSADSHPLADDIADGSLSPRAAGASDCRLGAEIGVADGGLADGFPICQITQATLMADTSLSNREVYLLSSALAVGNGGASGATAGSVMEVTLTIPAGTQIYGDTSVAASGLIVTRGSDIVVNGNADRPVVMSSADGGVIGGGDDFSGRNEWGGLILDGFAPVNEGGEVLSEAAPTGVNRFFGGNDPVDSSGSINYLVITESGQEFRLDEEIQGLTLEGVGAATSINFVQVHHSGDDGIELFGGTVSLKNIVVTGVNDDSLDYDLGWQGLAQHIVIRQASDNGDRGNETDNSGDNFAQQPRTQPVVVNMTILGSTGNEGSDTKGILGREGVGGFLSRVIITDADALGGEVFEDGCFDYDDTRDPLDSGDYRIDDSIFACSTGALSEADEEIEI